MLLKRIRIENYRCFKCVDVELDRTTVLIGENNSGKSSFLDGIRLCLSRNMMRRTVRLEDFDYHLETSAIQLNEVPPLSLILDFVLDADEPNDVLQALNDVLVFDAEDRQHVILQLTSEYDFSVSDFVTELKFLDVEGNALQGRAQRSQALGTFLQFVPVFHLNALRDAGREFQSRSAFWSPFLRDKDIPEDKRKTLQSELEELNISLISAHTPLQSVKQYLSKAQSVAASGGGNRIDINALPIRISQLLTNAQVSVSASTGASLPLERHGSGTQSLAVIFLFEAYLATMLGEQYDDAATPILAFEEPEAHLHPSAVRALWSAMEAIPGQKIVTTHSGDLLSCVSLGTIRRFCRRDGEIKVMAIQPNTLALDEQRKVEFHIQNSRGQLLFARCWLLCEGESEYWVFSQVAAILGVSLDALGISIVYNARLSGEEPLVKVANDLGISWYFVGDGDAQGHSSARIVRKHLQGRIETQHVYILQQKNIEVLLCESGYGGIYESSISQQKKHVITYPPGSCDYWEQVVEAQPNKDKPVRIREAMKLMTQRGEDGVPQQLKDIVSAGRALAETHA